MNALLKNLKTKKNILFMFMAFHSFCFYAQAQQNASIIPELSSLISQKTRNYIAQQLTDKFAIDQPFTPEEAQTLLGDLSALYELNGTQVHSFLYQDIFLDNKFDGKVLTAWILQKFKVLAPTRGTKCGAINDADFVACYSPAEKKIRLSPLFFRDGRIARLSTLLHEARHSQGYGHLTADKASEDGVANGARGAEWSFLAAITANCTNCHLIDKISAYQYSIAVSKKIKNLNSSDQKIYESEIGALRDPLEEKYLPLISKLSRERSYIHAMPSLCLNDLPFNEFKGNPEQTPAVDCILLYYFVNSQEAKDRPDILKRSFITRDGFLLILNPVEKK
jgi:hypothetical protein